jgi:hypothetical protein
MAVILFLPLEIQTKVVLTSSLDRFVSNKIFFMTFLYKTVKASPSKTGLFCLVFEWFGYQMSGTGIKLHPKTDHGLVFGC